MFEPKRAGILEGEGVGAMTDCVGVYLFYPVVEYKPFAVYFQRTRFWAILST